MQSEKSILVQAVATLSQAFQLSFVCSFESSYAACRSLFSSLANSTVSHIISASPTNITLIWQMNFSFPLTTAIRQRKQFAVGLFNVDCWLMPIQLNPKRKLFLSSEKFIHNSGMYKSCNLVWLLQRPLGGRGKGFQVFYCTRDLDGDGGRGRKEVSDWTVSVLISGVAEAVNFSVITLTSKKWLFNDELGCQ